MKRVGRQDTAPELAARRRLHAAGFRFRLHVRGMPGTPDIVLPRYRTVVFVHGCFWHGHDCRHGATRARTNTEFWDAKITANRERDSRKARELERLGWHVEKLWECQCGDDGALRKLFHRIRRQLPMGG